jgi:hypothetical protein
MDQTSTKPDYSASAFTTRTKTRAMEAFEKHDIILDDRENGRWRIAQKYDDGSIAGHFATEVISLWGGRLYVGGDIDDCTFAYYSGGHPQDTVEWHLAKLRWMGLNDDLGYYVVQKAAIGMTDGNRLTRAWNYKVAVHQLKEYLEEDDADWSERNKDALQEAFDLAEQGGDEHEVYEALSHMSDGGIDIIGYVGQVTASRVIFAWAACHRLCELIAEKDNTEVADGASS